MVTKDDEVTLKIESLRAYYTSKKGLVKAVNDVSFEVRKGESVGLFGESNESLSGISNDGFLIFIYFPSLKSSNSHQESEPFEEI